MLIPSHSMTSLGLGGDLINHGTMITSGLSEMSEAAASESILNALPLLIVYGGAESVVDPAGGPRLLGVLKNEQAKVVTIPDARQYVKFSILCDCRSSPCRLVRITIMLESPFGTCADLHLCLQLCVWSLPRVVRSSLTCRNPAKCSILRLVSFARNVSELM